MQTLVLDHLVYAVPDLPAAVAKLDEHLGVSAAYGGAHPGAGSHNALLSLGPASYLEIIAPDPEQPSPKRPRSFGLDTLDEPSLVTWAVAETDLKARATWAVARGYDPGQIIDAGRKRPDGVRLAWRSTKRPEALQGLPPPGDGLVPFLIDWGETHHPAHSAPQGCRLLSLRAEHPDPASVVAKLEALGVSLDVTYAPAPALCAVLAGPGGRIELR